MKTTTGDILEKIVKRWIRFQEIEAEIEEIETKENIKITIKTQTKKITMSTKVFPSEEILKEIENEIKEYRISVILEKRRDEIIIILNDPEREWQEACLS